MNRPPAQGHIDHLVVRHQQQLLGASQAVLRWLTQNMRPESVARIDEVLVFDLFSPNAQREICGLVVKAETTRLCGLGYDLQVSREALEFVVQEGFYPQLGARPLRKTVER